MPKNAIYVGRPSRLGNPYRPGDRTAFTPYKSLAQGETLQGTEPIDMFRADLIQMSLAEREEFLRPLRGKDLACWCGLSEPCHADVLLELANQ